MMQKRYEFMESAEQKVGYTIGWADAIEYAQQKGTFTEDGTIESLIGVSRLEVINYPAPKSGYSRDYVYYCKEGEYIELHYQDEGRTLKVFITEAKQHKP